MLIFHPRIGLGVILAVLMLAPATTAGQEAEIRREIIDSQRRLEALREERNVLQRDLTSLDGRVRNASAELANVERQVSASRSALVEVDFQVDAVGTELETASRDLLLTRERLLTGKAVLNRRLRDIYKRGPLHSVRVMLGAGSFSGLLTRYRYLRLIATYDRTLVRRVEQLETELSQENDNLRTSMARLDLLRQSRVGEVSALRSVEERHRQALDVYRAQEETAADRLEQLALDESRVTILLTNLEARRVEIERAAARGPAPSTFTAVNAGTLIWPVEGELIYRFGREVRPNGTVLLWQGIGIRAPTGTPVQAVEAGTVQFAGPLEGYGLTVILSHGGGFYTLYHYLEDLGVTQGREVAVGQVVGTVGGANSPEGPHLEFQIRSSESGLPRALDPLTWLRAQGG
jgi:septal ring factor EnvC (AmiA/AmiB activator)